MAAVCCDLCDGAVEFLCCCHVICGDEDAMCVGIVEAMAVCEQCLETPLSKIPFVGVCRKCAAEIGLAKKAEGETNVTIS